jgi:hypothetical protein|tara:strand:- start:64 stop:912 length:849 start_codon:yes stop_codon:yes gene_type:complete
MSASKQLKTLAEENPLIIKSRHAAKVKIALATKKDGSLDWKKLPKLVTTNTKLEKHSDDTKYLTAGFQLAPHWISGYNTCPSATIGCGTVCLFGSGHGQDHMIHNGNHNVWIARIARTIIWFEHRDEFIKQALKEIAAFKRRAARLHAKTALRPNVISDINFFFLFPSLWDQGLDAIYDYTKNIKHIGFHNVGTYHITLSRTEKTTDSDIDKAINNGVNVAVVFDTKKGQPLPSKWKHWDVIDGDLSDNRFLDKQINHKAVIVGLREKKTGKTENNGFIVKV